ncbi:alkylation response protein AidB-like acyl-CoA dehydrogenase [Streptosporangium becharense]|uniref:Acyl-[acyl-carrier-protein] dehydrogenase MbtN n=1 Tax=Streptosporangium becharense TaxID=1816182 RepID=A0A7W9MG28_9ACTN|nr:acyl-CoA dehydrogenase family protein [Streptosporangium becharense]MBB2909386.1 alkylation response protein AidB-like acyl-CoA dehydrogenase [Streptosporangium becharense]MBB5819657.1 alkylation response protein AidB-like acyl-CoA dehydrogenase [Streptosporangium becharense]
MQRDLYEEEHGLFRETVRDFLAREVVPHHPRWEKEGIVPREVWKKAGEIGMFGFGVPEEFGGSGVTDFRYNAVIVEEIIRIGASGLGFSLHNDVMAPYLVDLTDDGQKARWLPGFTSGELITAIAMTEPGAGSDLQGIRTTAVREGDHYIVNGQKTFITNGINSDLVVTVVKTDPGAGARGISLLVAERGMEGFTRGRNLEKIGMHAQDTAELFFDNVRVPADNLLGGEEGQGFFQLMRNLPQERLSIAVMAVAAAESVLETTIEYCRNRTAFGRSIGGFQNTRFVLAELDTEVEIARHYVDKCIRELNAGRLSAVDAAKAKWWTTELQTKVIDRCLQLHGGYGYMTEYPVAKAWLDSRVQTIYGGTTEIMKEIIGRSFGF